MSPARHPGPEALLAYSVGTLPSGGALTLRVHVETCAHCRSTLRFLEALGGALIGGLETQDTEQDPAATRRALAGLTSAAADPTPSGGEQGRQNVLRTLKTGIWVWLAPGLRVASVKNAGDQGEHVFLLRGKAGSRFPRHGHRGVERIAVLEGAFLDDGELYRAGDYVECETGRIHRPVIAAASQCLCLLAIEGWFEFGGVMGWIAARNWF